MIHPSPTGTQTMQQAFGEALQAIEIGILEFRQRHHPNRTLLKEMIANGRMNHVIGSIQGRSQPTAQKGPWSNGSPPTAFWSDHLGDSSGSGDDVHHGMFSRAIASDVEGQMEGCEHDPLSIQFHSLVEQDKR